MPGRVFGSFQFFLVLGKDDGVVAVDPGRCCGTVGWTLRLKGKGRREGGRGKKKNSFEETCADDAGRAGPCTVVRDGRRGLWGVLSFFHAFYVASLRNSLSLRHSTGL